MNENEKKYLKKVREFLKNAEFLDTAINDKLEEKERLKSTLSKTTVFYSVNAGCPIKQEVQQKEKMMIDLISLEEEIDKDIVRLFKVKRHIKDIINLVPNLKQKTILSKKYLNFHTWEKISDDMNMDIRYVQRLECLALIKNQKNIENFLEKKP